MRKKARGIKGKGFGHNKMHKHGHNHNSVCDETCPFREARLSDLEPTEKCLVKEIKGQGMIRRRLFDMGITPGAEIYVRKRAPLGDPIELTLRGYQLSIRQDEADKVVVEPILQ